MLIDVYYALTIVILSLDIFITTNTFFSSEE